MTPPFRRLLQQSPAGIRIRRRSWPARSCPTMGSGDDARMAGACAVPSAPCATCAATALPAAAGSRDRRPGALRRAARRRLSHGFGSSWPDGPPAAAGGACRPGRHSMTRNSAVGSAAGAARTSTRWADNQARLHEREPRCGAGNGALDHVGRHDLEEDMVRQIGPAHGFAARRS